MAFSEREGLWLDSQRRAPDSSAPQHRYRHTHTLYPTSSCRPEIVLIIKQSGFLLATSAPDLGCKRRIGCEKSGPHTGRFSANAVFGFRDSEGQWLQPAADLICMHMRWSWANNNAHRLTKHQLFSWKKGVRVCRKDGSKETPLKKSLQRWWWW